jgi:hypothetical protein
MTKSNDDFTNEANDDITIEDWPAQIKHECTSTAPCGRLTCAACSDPYRLRWIRRTLATTKAHPGQQEIAIIPLPIPVMYGHATMVRGSLRHVLARVDFQGKLLRGAIDVIWISDLNGWIPCAHALAIDVPRDAWTRLRAYLRNNKSEYFEESGFTGSFPLKVQRLRDPERQIPNLVRFHRYFWPRSPTGAARAGRLSADRLEWLTAWADDQTFKDFTFEFQNLGREN